MKKHLLITMLLANIIIPNSQACTGIILETKNKDVIYGRTMEYAIDLHSQLISIPKNQPLTATSNYPEALKWKTKYTVIGLNGLNLNLLVDGVNEKGLAGGMFMFPTLAEFSKYNKADSAQSLSSIELLTYLLTNYASVDEVKKHISTIKVNDSKFSKLNNMTIPVHYSITDSSGASIVIEYTKDGLHVYDNKVHVMTNSPTFPWLVENLNNYTTLSPQAITSNKSFGNYKLDFRGEGFNANALPGSYNSSSRFVRAAFYVNNSPEFNTVDEAIQQGWTILNNFDIPKGAVVNINETGNFASEETTWTSMIDLQNLVYYAKFKGSNAICSIAIKDIKSPDIKTYQCSHNYNITNVIAN